MQHPFPNDENADPPPQPDVTVLRVRPHQREKQCGHYDTNTRQCENTAVYNLIHTDGTKLPLCGRHYVGPGPKAIR